MLVPHQELPVAGPEPAPQPMEGEDQGPPRDSPPSRTPSALACVCGVYAFLARG